MFGPWLPHAAGTERKQRHAAVVGEFVLGPQRKRGCQIPWLQYAFIVIVICHDREHNTYTLDSYTYDIILYSYDIIL